MDEKNKINNIKENYLNKDPHKTRYYLPGKNENYQKLSKTNGERDSHVQTHYRL